MIPCEEIFTVFGLPAVVTAPRAERSVDTTVVWSSYDTEQMPVGSDLPRYTPRKIASLKRSEVVEVPAGTEIVAAEYTGGTARTWIVEGTERVDVDIVRVIVIEQREGCDA